MIIAAILAELTISKGEAINVNLMQNIDLTIIKHMNLLSHVKKTKHFLTFVDIEIEEKITTMKVLSF